MADTPIDAVEIKCTLSDTSLDLAMMSLHLGDPDRKRTVWFFDSIDSTECHPRLFRAGIILRLRRKKNGPGESTLKLRPARAELLVDDFRAGAGHFGEDYSVAWDWAHDQVLAASMDADVDREAADKMVNGPAADSFSADQLRLLHEAGSRRLIRSPTFAPSVRLPPCVGMTSATARWPRSARSTGPTATTGSSSSSPEGEGPHRRRAVSRRAA